VEVGTAVVVVVDGTDVVVLVLVVLEVLLVVLDVVLEVVLELLVVEEGVHRGRGSDGGSGRQQQEEHDRRGSRKRSHQDGRSSLHCRPFPGRRAETDCGARQLSSSDRRANWR